MGRAHALAHHRAGPKIAGLVNCSGADLPDAPHACRRLRTADQGLARNPRPVAIATFSVADG